MRKLLSILLIVLTCMSMAFAIACNEPEEPEHTCVYDKEVVSSEYLMAEATCQIKALYFKSCECGKKGTETFESGDVVSHSYLNGRCKWCSDPEVAEGQVNNEEWLNAIKEEVFSNVTISYEYSVTGYGKTESVYKFADGRVERIHNDLGIISIYEDEYAESQRELVLGLFLGFIAQYEEFEFDSEEGIYRAPNEVTTTTDSPTGGYSVTEKMTNGRLKFSSDNKIESFVCDIEETIIRDGQPPRVNVFEDMLWTFSDYGTTVAQEVPVTPNIPDLEYGEGSEEEWIKAVNISENCVIKARQSAFEQGIFMYYSDMEVIKYNEVFKADDTYYEKDGENYYVYYKNQTGNYQKVEEDEHGYQYQTTIYLFEGIFDELTFDEASGLYLADEIVVSESEYITVKNVKAGFVDGKLAYLTYEEENGGGSYVYEYSFEFKNVEITFPTVD